MKPTRSFRAAIVVVALSLVFVQAVLAADTRPIKLNSGDQAAAKAATLKAADLGPGWKGGVKKPDLTPSSDCSAKVPDRVLTGAAKTVFQAQGAMVTSEANILESPAMVAADWKRTVGNHAFMVACVRNELSEVADVKLISVKKLGFPKLTHYSARYRIVADFGPKGSRLRVLIDMIQLGQGRTEISIVLSARYGDRAAAEIAERRLAQIVVGRITR